MLSSIASRILGRNHWNARIDQEALMPHARVIFDVGAHVGHTSSVYLKMYPEADIWAFEPTPDSFEQLKTRFKNHPRVHPVSLALGDEGGQQDFYLARGSQMNSMLASKSRPTRTIQIQASTLDCFCAANSVDHIDILKVDVQGMESRLFCGAVKMFHMKAVRLLLTEVCFSELYEGMPLFWDLHRQLEGFDFKLFGLYSLARSRDGSLEFADALYRPIVHESMTKRESAA
jgi:FkbM family methyltransferase